MTSPECDFAVASALDAGGALLKFISPNDAGVTLSHQYGFLLPQSAYPLLTPHAPVRGRNDAHDVTIHWPDGTATDSVVRWYGRAKSEYRLTRFGRDFKYRNPDAVGDLLVIVPQTPTVFRAFVLKTEEDIEGIIAALNIAFDRGSGVYDASHLVLTAEAALVRLFEEYVGTLDAFPSGDEFSARTLEILRCCDPGFEGLPPDRKLTRGFSSEFDLFKLAEEHLVLPGVRGPFASIEEFIDAAKPVLNRRASRAGRSLENHFHYCLEEAGVPHDTRARNIPGAPDFVIPSASAYADSSFPAEQLFIVAAKTTCKDRWRQVLQEGPRVHTKYLLTLQEGISPSQLMEMKRAGVVIVVPQSLFGSYVEPDEGGILSLQAFLDLVSARRQDSTSLS